MTRASDTAKLLGAGGSILGSLDVGGGQIGGRRNVVINGAMNVAQRGTSTTGLGATSGYYTVDKYRIAFADTAGRLTMTQTADGPSGFANCIKLDCTTADTSIAAGEIMWLEHRIEGQDLQQFKKGTSDAEQYSVSFYVKGNANATYALELHDTDNARHISKLFSVTTAWTRITMTFPADTTGAFTDDNNLSLSVRIWLHAGSTYTGGTLQSSAWADLTGGNRAAGITSFFDSTDRTFFLTGLQMEVGSVATPFEHRSFGEELVLCQRYFRRYYTTGYIATLQAYNSSATYGPMIQINPEMRSSVSVSSSGNFKITTATSNTATNGEGAFSGLTRTQNTPFEVIISGGPTVDGASGLTAGHASVLVGSSGSYIDADCEL